MKSTTRELSYIILTGAFLCYFSSAFFVGKPHLLTCTGTRTIPGVALSMIFGALSTKTNRIARILAGTKKIITKKPKFVSVTAQVAITCSLVLGEFIASLVLLYMGPPTGEVIYPSRKSAKLICGTSEEGGWKHDTVLIASLAPNMLLIIMCTFYAIKTRNLPENFNEAKFIGFCMYTTCIIWVGFLAVYFTSDLKAITACVSIDLSATVALVLLFVPRVYIMLFHPEKNVRSAFTTSKEVRCHIGGGNMSRTSSKIDPRYFKIIFSCK